MAGLGLRRVAIVTLLFAVQSLSADYFDDQGNFLGVFRTDYANPNEGDQNNPLGIGGKCYFPDINDQILVRVHPTQACPSGIFNFPGGPYSRGDFSASSFWVISANVERYSYEDNVASEAPLGTLQGAPSLSTDTLGDPDLLSFSMFPIGAGTRYMAYLFADNEGTGGEKFGGVLPFLSVGGHKNWGNDGLVGRMNVANAPHRTKWNSTVYIASPADGAVLFHYVLAIAKWNDIKRMLFVQLYHHLAEHSRPELEDPGEQRHWNWTAKNSFWYPGADIAYVDAEDIDYFCGPGVGNVPQITTLGQTYNYDLDWEFLFDCLSNHTTPRLFDDPMPPSGGVPIIGVHWAVEVSGDSSIFVGINDMKMVN